MFLTTDVVLMLAIVIGFVSGDVGVGGSKKYDAFARYSQPPEGTGRYFTLNGTQFYYSCDSHADWFTSSLGCLSLGMGSFMISVHNSFENEFMASASQFAVSSCGCSTRQHWIGLVYTASTHDFHWFDGSGTLDGGYTNWGPGEPGNHTEGNYCVYQNTQDAKWYIDDCDGTEYNYICKKIY